MHSLTEAAHIDDALSQDEKEIFDVAELLSEYVSNINLKHGEHEFIYTGPGSGVNIQGSDLRIAQLLDKLKDNALDFANTGSEIKFELSTDNGRAIIRICNQGPTIPDEIINNLCSGIISHRQGTGGEPHLGIGLYVASRIAKHQSGDLEISNASNNDGVCVAIQLQQIETTENSE